MVETVGFFETAVELEQLLAWSKPQSERLALIALTPEADAAAELRAVPYRTIEDCYDETDLLAQGMAQYRLAERLCVAIDRHLEAAGGAEWPRHGVSFRHLYKHVKTILDALLHRTLTLKRALIAQAAQRVVHVLDPADTRPANPAALPRSLCALLLPHVARQLGCQVVSLPAASHRHVQDRPRGFAAARAVRPLIRRLVSHVDALRRLVERRRVSASVWRPSGVNDALNGGGSGPTTVVLTSLWSDRDVLTAWQASGGRLVSWRALLTRSGSPEPGRGDAEVDAILSRCWEPLYRDESIRRGLIFDGVDIGPAMEPWLRQLMRDVWCRYARVAAALETALATVPNPIVLGSTFVRVEEVACVVTARRMGIPVVAYQHGGFQGYADVPMERFCDVGLPDYFLSYGSGVSEVVEQMAARDDSPRGGEGRTQPITVGSADLDRLLTTHRSFDSAFGLAQDVAKAPRRVRRRGRTALYVVTTLMGDQRYFSLHMYPAIWYWRLQRQVVERLSRSADVELMIRLDPRDEVPNPLEAWVRRQRLRSCRILRETPFAEALAMADLFIIDSPSTTLLQALTTDKPILAFADHRFMRFHPKAIALLNKRATLSTTPQDFLRDIETALRAPSWDPLTSPDDEFLHGYGTPGADGGSADRVVKALWEIARQPRGVRFHHAPHAPVAVADA